MKKLMSVLVITVVSVAGLISCKNGDQQSAGALTQTQKDSVARDSANFTTIEWLDSTYKDMGKINEGQIVEVSFRFKNTGDKNLIITDVRASCGCTIPEKPGKPYAPGEEGVINAKFDSNGKQGTARKEIFVNANTKPNADAILTFSVDITPKK